MGLVLGVPRLFWGHSPSQDVELLLLPQLGPGTEQALAAGQWCVAEGKYLSHSGYQRVSAGGDGDRDHADEDEP